MTKNIFVYQIDVSFKEDCGMLGLDSKALARVESHT